MAFCSLRVSRSLALLTTLASLAIGQTEIESVCGQNPFEQFGFHLAGLGDVNGDGTSDWIATRTLGARVHSGADRSLLWEIGFAPNTPGSTGPAAGLGDVDGDGAPDVLLSIPTTPTSPTGAGRVVVLSGRTGARIRVHEGTDHLGLFGTSLAGLPDVDADGVADYAIGAPGEGRARVYSGASGAVINVIESDGQGFAAALDHAGDVDGDGAADLVIGAGVDAVYVHTATTGDLVHLIRANALGVPHGSRFGAEVAGLGDVDGDGLADFAVAAPFEEVNGLYPVGRVRAFSGATGALLWSVPGPETRWRFGQSIDALGDLDGDGANELIVGAPSIYGSVQALGVAQTEPTLARIVSGATGRLIYTFRGDFQTDLFGWDVAGLGDVDGDGLDDVLVGAPHDRCGGVTSGAARVFSTAGCPQTRPYCTSLPNSKYGRRARLGSIGSLSLGADELELYVVNAPSEHIGAFVFGRAPAEIPMGDGILCIGGPLDVFAIAPSNFFGIAHVDLAPVTALPVVAGDTLFFQYVFRDVDTSGMSVFHASDALAATFCP